MANIFRNQDLHSDVYGYLRNISTAVSPHTRSAKSNEEFIMAVKALTALSSSSVASLESMVYLLERVYFHRVPKAMFSDSEARALFKEKMTNLLLSVPVQV